MRRSDVTWFNRFQRGTLGKTSHSLVLGLGSSMPPSDWLRMENLARSLEGRDSRSRSDARECVATSTGPLLKRKRIAKRRKRPLLPDTSVILSPPETQPSNVQVDANSLNYIHALNLAQTSRTSTTDVFRQLLPLTASLTRYRVQPGHERLAEDSSSANKSARVVAENQVRLCRVMH